MPPVKSNLRRVHYVLSTHWDREWYRTFQGFRRQLVHLMDKTLDGLASGFLKGPFTTDGQAILLEDYLEVRPEQRKQIESYVKSGKVRVGPWFVMPDEWLVSGESIIRNLRLGRQTARKFGAPSSQAGFICDLFGHISQLPQIFQGFGITNAFLWRGVEPRQSAQFYWEGADGSRLLCHRFAHNGYCDFGFDVRRLMEPNLPFDAVRVAADLRTWLRNEAARSAVPPILLFDGGDHMQFDEETYRLIAETKPGADFPYQVVFTTLDDYMEEVAAHATSIRDVVRGELREAGHSPGHIDMQWLIPGVLSSRIWIKQMNAECQSLLCHWAEPFACLASTLLEEEYPAGYLDVAWRWLLLNHPHDSICGCSIDAVHEDMKYRFAQCRQIAAGQTQESLQILAASVAGDVGEKEVRVLVANPLPREIDEPFTLVLHIPSDWGTYNEFFGFEPKIAFRIFDAENNDIPYQLLSQDVGRAGHRYVPTKIPVALKSDVISVALRLRLPALGYTTLTVRAGDKIPLTGHTLPVRHAQVPGLATSERSMENEFLALTVESNGTLTVLDKRSNQTYRRLLTFEDSADIGDGWFHGPPVNDQTFVSSATSAEVALVHDGKSLCTFRIRVEMRVPEKFEKERRVRSENFGTLTIDSLVTLRAGCDRVEISTAVDNRCQDHRLRVLFPSEAKTGRFLADTAFDVVERTIALPADNHQARELAVDAAPQQSWTAVADGKRGLAVVSSGLPEAMVYDKPDRPIAVTLFRSTSRTVFTDGEPEGQLQGKMTFTYWIVPFAGKTPRCQLADYGLRLTAGVKTAQLRAADVPLFRRAGQLPPTASFFQLKGDAIVTSVRHIADGLEIRLYNPETQSRRAAIAFAKHLPGVSAAYRSATRVDMESKPLGKPIKMGGKYRLALKPKEIATVHFQ